MKQRLREALGAEWLVIDLLEANEDIMRALRTERLILFMAIGLIIVVASLNIVSTLVLMVADKTKEIGTLSAMGARASSVAAVFMLQGLLIGAVGSVGGIALGYGISRWLDSYRVLAVDPDIYYLEYIPFATQPSDMLWVGTAAFLVSFLATLYPALKAARLDPVEALRHE
jgi:lipoprotein-releasing system permease protein